MIITATAQKYARALFELAKEREQTDAILADFKSFITLVESNPDLKSVLKLPDAKAREKILLPVFQNRFSDLFLKLISSVLKNNRQILFPQIFSDYLARHDNFNNRIQAEVTTAFPLPKQTAQDLKAKLEQLLKGDVRIENKIDSAILGGMIIRVNGQVLNASVMNKFENLKTFLTKN